LCTTVASLAPLVATAARAGDEIAAEILELLKGIWLQGTTVFLATHQARVASELQTRTLTLVGGELLKDEG